MSSPSSRHTGHLSTLTLLFGLTLPSLATADLGVQIGAYRSPDNAARTARNLTDAGVANSQILSAQGGKSLTKVIVGPYTSTDQASAARIQLAARGWSGIIVNFQAPEVLSAQTDPSPTPSVTPSADRLAGTPDRSKTRKPSSDTRVLPTLPFAAAAHAEWSGSVALEHRQFPQSALDPRQHNQYLSLTIQPEYYREWDDRRQSFTFVPYLRLDQHDPERSHFDVRELTWLKAASEWELRLGVRKVFWGVTESQHLVDIINQTDLVEDPDGEDKLGQPMLNLALIRDWGTIDLYMLPYFRERTFPGTEGRLRFAPIATNKALFESGAKQRHVDVAVRWSHSLSDWDVGLAHFSGTGREPLLVAVPGYTGLVPYYPLIEQTSVDMQTTKGSWLWKLEAITRGGQGDRYSALTGGFEYTFTGVMTSDADLGVLAEYLLDDRDHAATTPFQDDVFVGMRVTLNDAQSSELLAGVIADRHNGARLYNVEASRRLGQNWKLSLTARAYAGIPSDDLLYNVRHDDYLQLELARYF